MRALLRSRSTSPIYWFAGVALLLMLPTGCGGIGATQGVEYQLTTDEAINLVEEALVRTGFTGNAVIDRLEGNRVRVEALLERDRASETGGALQQQMTVLIEPADADGRVRIRAEQSEARGGSYAGQSGPNYRRSFYRNLNLLVDRS